MPVSKVVKTARGERSRRNILETTRRLIAQHGSNNVTLDQVANACNIAKSSILWHFGSKEALFLEVVDTVYHRFAEAVVSKFASGLTTSEKVTHLLKDYCALSLDRPEIPYIFFSFAFSSKQQEKIKRKIDDIYDWNRKAYMQHLAISETLAAILLGMLNGAVIQWLMDPSRIKLEVILEKMVPIFRDLIEDEHATKGAPK